MFRHKYHHQAFINLNLKHKLPYIEYNAISIEEDDKNSIIVKWEPTTFSLKSRFRNLFFIEYLYNAVSIEEDDKNSIIGTWNPTMFSLKSRFRIFFLFTKTSRPARNNTKWKSIKDILNALGQQTSPFCSPVPV
jgi:hypothetical protein